MNIKFKLIEYGSSSWREAVKLREQILRIPLGSRFTRDELKEEEQHLHVGGYIGNKLVATAVLVPESMAMKMQRVVVDDTLTNSGIGSRMMIYCEALARERDFREIYCHARDTAVRFYSKNAYQKEGEYFLEDDIPHLKMLKHLGGENDKHIILS